MASTVEIRFNIFPHCAESHVFPYNQCITTSQKSSFLCEVCELRHAATAGLLHWLFRGHQRPQRNQTMRYRAQCLS